MLPRFMLSRMRTRAMAFMSQRCAIFESGGGLTNYGASTGDEKSLAADVPCRVISEGKAGEAGLYGEQERIITAYRLVIPARTPAYDFPLRADQRVVVEGIRYQIIEVTSDWTDGIDRQAVMMRTV